MPLPRIASGGAQRTCQPVQPLLWTRFPCAPVAQLDRASDYESEGRTFESFRARQFSQVHQIGSKAGTVKRSGDSKVVVETDERSS